MMLSEIRQVQKKKYYIINLYDVSKLIKIIDWRVGWLLSRAKGNKNQELFNM